ncbi:wings apart-like protein 2 [Cornus florida]|uniref:wings apart-like protein 2 n=1 Tax=Cornus florida TaxID=4283 RepID=UPI0028A232FD|nr:wings apart-like protein 2 [Cornus florida]
MIVRTYGRRNSRNRGMARSYSDSGFDDDVSDSFRDSSSQESPQDIYSFAFSSQDSSHWAFDSDPLGSNLPQESRQLAILPPRKPLIGGNLKNGDGDIRKSKKARNGKSELEVPKKLKSKRMRSVSVVPATLMSTATLMETQEFGEMMEHVDEVNFALDGLRKGQPARIRRASLLSLLSICGTAQQRRLLRTHGMAKTIIDAVLELSFDDSPSNLAAAALFYILTSDGQEDHLLDSPGCIRFLIKLLTPLTSDATKDKVPTIGHKLLAFRKDAGILQDVNGVDSTSAAIMLKVQEILVSCKEMKSSDGNDAGMGKPELSPKWIALLVMEKACLSTISLEDTTGAVRKTGGNFKEKLRELGGLDAVFEVTRNCHSIMEGWLEQNSSSIQESKDNVNLESLVLLLKCLKIMENATFLSKDNQIHLLGMKGKFDHKGSPRSFTKLVIKVIKILSGLSLLKSSSSSSYEEEFYNLSNGICAASEMPLMEDSKVDSDEIISISSSIRFSRTEQTTSQRSLSESQNSEWLFSGLSRNSNPSSEFTNTSADNCLLKMRINSSTSGSCSGTSRSSTSGVSASNDCSRMNFGLGKEPKFTGESNSELPEDSQDPFAFDEDDFEPSKWDLLSGRQRASQTQKPKATSREHEDGCQSIVMLSHQVSGDGENHHSNEVSCSSAVDEKKSNLLVDCLLAAVKVLMNLTNDNPMGCQQIASCGGLETLSSLIANHFPLFSSFLPPVSEMRDTTSFSKSSIEVDHQNDGHLTDQELDFLVAILGLLVNLVEKDSCNRSRLASASVSLPGLEAVEDESCRDVIPLLCSIFLANQGAGEADEGKQLTWDDEAAVLQGEREAEKMIVEAYSALLLAFLSTESMSIRNGIAEYLPDRNLAVLVPVLERFVEFHLTLDMISPETHTTVLEVIESCRVP